MNGSQKENCIVKWSRKGNISALKGQRDGQVWGSEWQEFKIPVVGREKLDTGGLFSTAKAFCVYIF